MRIRKCKKNNCKSKFSSKVAKKKQTKIPKSLLKQARKYKVKAYVKKGSKRVPKKLSLLKRQIQKKKKLRR